MTTIPCSVCSGTGLDADHCWPDGSHAHCVTCDGYGEISPSTNAALVSALYELARHVDEDVPVEHRSKHLTNALSYAFDLVEAFEETPTHP